MGQAPMKQKQLRVSWGRQQQQRFHPDGIEPQDSIGQAGQARLTGFSGFPNYPVIVVDPVLIRLYQPFCF